jgi:hypothetical protein
MRIPISIPPCHQSGLRNAIRRADLSPAFPSMLMCPPVISPSRPGVSRPMDPPFISPPVHARVTSHGVAIPRPIQRRFREAPGVFSHLHIKEITQILPIAQNTASLYISSWHNPLIMSEKVHGSMAVSDSLKSQANGIYPTANVEHRFIWSAAFARRKLASKESAATLRVESRMNSFDYLLIS